MLAHACHDDRVAFAVRVQTLDRVLGLERSVGGLVVAEGCSARHAASRSSHGPVRMPASS